MLSEFVLIGFYLVTLLFSVIIHEVSHGVMALYLGDMTAKYAGRLTLNPKSHIDPIGTVLVPLILFFSQAGFLFGWAKPVPYNPYNLRNQKWGSTLVALAGPLSNIGLALSGAIIAKIIPLMPFMKYKIVSALSSRDWEGIASIVSGSPGAILYVLCLMVIFWNVILAVFNMIPVPPLDGSKLLFDLLNIPSATRVMLEQYSIFILFGVIIFLSGPISFLIDGVLSYFISLTI